MTRRFGFLLRHLAAVIDHAGVRLSLRGEPPLDPPLSDAEVESIMRDLWDGGPT